MTIAVTLPVTRDRAGLVESVRIAEGVGFEALVLAEPPLGAWRNGMTAAAFTAAHSELPLGVAVDAGARHPIRLVEDIVVLQQIAGIGLWVMLMAGSGGQAGPEIDRVLEHLGPDSQITPSPSPLAARPWLVSRTPADVRAARARNLMTLVPAGTERSSGDGAYGDAPSLVPASEPAPGVVLVTAGTDGEIESAAETVAQLRYPGVSATTWARVATERLS